MTGFPGAFRARAAVGLLPLALLLAGCGGVDAVGGLVTGAPKDPAEAQIARLTGQGFTLVSDGRGSGGPTALRYQGSPAAVIACQSGGRAAASDQSGTAASPDGLYTVTQTGRVGAYVIVAPTGDLRGIYVNSLARTVAASDGTVVAKQLETIEFAPGGAGTFRNGVSCQASS